MSYIRLAVLVLFFTGGSAWGQNTWDGNGNLNVNTAGRGGTAGGSAVTPAPRTIVTLDIKTVTTGGTAVTAIAVGNKTAGCFIQNPPSATINLGVNEIGTASGTTSSGDTTFIIPGQSYSCSASTGAVSVISSDNSHPFSGYGLR